MRQAVGLVALGLVVVVACAGVAGGSSSAGATPEVAVGDSPVVATSAVDADRSLNVTAAEPGEVVRVTTTVELPGEDNLDYIDDFDPAFGDAEFVSATEDGDEILPNFLDVANDSAVLVFNDIGPSTVEVVFDVTVPDDADLGDTHEFDGLVQFDDEETPVGGDGTLTVGEDDPAEFAVDIESVPGEVVAGEAFDVEYAVENVGDETETQEVTVAVDGETIATETVELSGGEETVKTANYTTEESDVPEVSVEVASANDTATATVEVVEPAEFVVDIASIPGEVVAGETVDIEYTVENTGEETASQEITTSVG